MIELVVNGQPYTQFQELEATIRLDTIARGFRFTAVAEQGIPLPFNGSDAVEIVVDGETILTGFIDEIGVDTASEDHTINIQGRSATADLVDSTLEALEINMPISLQKIIERVIEFLGLDIGVVDQIGDLADFNIAEDKVRPSVGENAFQFIERLARKRQVLLTTDGQSNVVITRASAETLSVGLQNVFGSTGNNIKSSTVRYNHANRYRDYSVKSQLNVPALVFSDSIDLSGAVNQGGDATDTDIRVGRKLVMEAEKASSNEQAKERATWEANIRRTRSQSYNATMVGHSLEDGSIWAVNVLVPIVDTFADINASMLLNSVRFFASDTQGSISDLGFVPPDSYLVEISEPEPIENVGDNLFP